VTTIAPGTGSSARSADPDPQAIASAVEACPSVSRLSGGVGGEIATYLPGARVNGVRVRSDAITVNVIAYWNSSAVQVGDEVRAAVRGAASSSGASTPRIDVTIDDLELPQELALRLGLVEPEPPAETESVPAASPVASPPAATAPAATAPRPAGAASAAPTPLTPASSTTAASVTSSTAASGLSGAEPEPASGEPLGTRVAAAARAAADAVTGAVTSAAATASSAASSAASATVATASAAASAAAAAAAPAPAKPDVIPALVIPPATSGLPAPPVAPLLPDALTPTTRPTPPAQTGPSTSSLTLPWRRGTKRPGRAADRS